jgi:hypothetical protein
VFPEEFFSSGDWADGLKIQRLKPQDGESETIDKWIQEGVFPAMEKGYVRRLKAWLICD